MGKYFFIVFIILLGFLTQHEYRKFQVEQKESVRQGKMIPFNSSILKSLEFKTGEQVITLDQKEKVWALAQGEHKDDADSHDVGVLLLDLFGREGRQIKTSSDQGDFKWGDFGLDPALAQIKMTYETPTGVKVFQIRTSVKKAFDGSSYLKIIPSDSETPQLWTSSSPWASLSLQSFEVLRLKNIFPLVLNDLKFDDLTAIQFIKKKESLDFELKDNVWKSSAYPDWEFSQDRLKNFIDLLSGVKTLDFKDVAYSGKEAPDYKIILKSEKEKEVWEESLQFYKLQDRVKVLSSLRPKAHLSLDLKKFAELKREAIGFRSLKSPFYLKDLKANSVTLKTKKIGFQSHLRDNIWVLTSEKKDKHEFNGAQVTDLVRRVSQLKAREYVVSSEEKTQVQERSESLSLSISDTKSKKLLNLEILGEKQDKDKKSKVYLMSSNLTKENFYVSETDLKFIFETEFFKKLKTRVELKEKEASLKVKTDKSEAPSE